LRNILDHNVGRHASIRWLFFRAANIEFLHILHEISAQVHIQPRLCLDEKGLLGNASLSFSGGSGSLGMSGLKPGLVKCGIVCRERLSHQQNRNKREYGDSYPRTSGNPLGGSIIPKGVIWWLVAMGVAACGILTANWAVPPNEHKNRKSDPRN
jgi:hypothetical protein